MASLIEFHGRLFHVDPLPGSVGAQRLAEPGRYDLRLALHARRDDLEPLWAEEQAGVPVSVGGYFGVVLGERLPLPDGLFDGTPRWLAAIGVGASDGVQTVRVPVLGHAIRVYEQLEGIRERLAAVEAALQLGERRVVNVNKRLRRLERGKGALLPVLRHARALDTRLARLDSDDGRIAHLEDELEEVVGPDGDIIDIIERLERIEGVGPGQASVDPKQLAELARRLDELGERVKALARGGGKK